MSTYLQTEIEIMAPADRVWEILTDFAAYPEWNPFIPEIDGNTTTGARLSVQLQPPGGRGMRMKPTVVAATSPHEFRWLGHLVVPGLFDGEHRFQIEPLGPDRIRFIQAERFTGMLAPLIMRSIERRTRQGFEAMNQALKARAEAHD